MNKSSELENITSQMMALWQDYLAKTTGMEGMQTVAAAMKDPMAWSKMMTDFNQAVAANPFAHLMGNVQNTAEKGQDRATTESRRTETAGTASDGQHVLLLQLVSRLADVERRLADLESRLKK